MTELWEAIKAWPTIIQGAAGSALFALVLFIGQRASTWTAQRIASVSINRRRSSLVSRIARIRAGQATENSDRSYYAAILWLRASRNVIKGLIWLALGLCFGSFAGAFGVVGYLGCIFYLFGALDVVKSIKKEECSDQQLALLEQELESLPSD